jgi:sensor histidine kinase regulating citrate/malate metabolism
LLLKNLENDALSHLKTDVRVVQYTIERLQTVALSTATSIADNADVKKAAFSVNKKDLFSVTSKLLLSYNINILAVTDTAGKVMMRGEDKDSVGDTLIFDPTVKSALAGKKLATVVSLPGAIAPRIQIKAASPMYNGASVSGVISTGFWLDSAFVDGVKEITGLDVTVFGDNKRAATTFVAPDGKSRFIGTLETNENILSKVLTKGDIYVGTATVLSQPYYTAYAPLKTVGDKPIGMLFVGKPQTTLFDAARTSINTTFLGSVILILFSLVPAYFFSRFLKEQAEA